MSKYSLERPKGLYSGWGPEPNVRNQGDDLCHRAAIELLEEQGFPDWVDVRDSIKPVTEPWEHDLVIGGGTVLPQAFEALTGPGLKAASRIKIFGSGCLNAAEVHARHLSNIDITPYERADVIGVRGPLSAEHYKSFFDKIVPYIGDLAFRYAQPKPIDRDPRIEQPRVSFFFIENDMPHARLVGRFQQVIDLYTDFAHELKDADAVFTTTDRAHPVFDELGLQTHFNTHRQVATADDLVDAVTSSDYIVTERLHPAIIAACYGIPFTYLQTTSKSRDLELLLQAKSKGLLPSACFIDMSCPQTSIREAFLQNSNTRELPEMLSATACSIARQLEDAAAQLASELLSEA